MDSTTEEKFSRHHSLYPQEGNSDFFQSSPEQHKNLFKLPVIGSQPYQNADSNQKKKFVLAASKVEMGTDPMTDRQVSEKDKQGSDYNIMAASKQESSVDQENKSSHSYKVSVNSDKYLPNKKIKRKPGEQQDITEDPKENEDLIIELSEEKKVDITIANKNNKKDKIAILSQKQNVKKRDFKKSPYQPNSKSRKGKAMSSPPVIEVEEEVVKPTKRKQ